MAGILAIVSCLMLNLALLSMSLSPPPLSLSLYIRCNLTKTDVENVMEIFITLTKNNTRKWRKEGTHCSSRLLTQYILARPIKCLGTAQGFFRWVWAQGRCLDRPGSRLHSPKKGCLRRRAISLASPRRIKA